MWPVLGAAAVPDGLICRLGKAIQLASRLHHLDLPRDEDGADTSPDFLEPRFDPDFDRQARGKVEGTTVQTVEVQKERFAYWNLDMLFMVCDEHHGAHDIQSALFVRKCLLIGLPSHAVGTDPARHRVAALCAPLLLTRCAAVFSTYVADAPLRGKMPFPRRVSFPILPPSGDLADDGLLVSAEFGKRSYNTFCNDFSRCDYRQLLSACPCDRLRPTRKRAR